MSEKTERPASPCIGYCSTAVGDDVCRGCGRTFAEIADWIFMNDEEKEKVWQRLEAAGLWPPNPKRPRY
jgi:predicted Fe-S protein YdhL (DUF1289 family)